MASTLVVSAEVASVGNFGLEFLPCERTAAWDEHFKVRQKYIEALDAFCKAVQLVIQHSRLTALACDASADHTSEAACHVKKSLACAVVGKRETPELCEV